MIPGPECGDSFDRLRAMAFVKVESLSLDKIGAVALRQAQGPRGCNNKGRGLRLLKSILFKLLGAACQSQAIKIGSKQLPQC